MITVPGCFCVAAACVLLTSEGIAGESPSIGTTRDRAAATRDTGDRWAHALGGLDTRRPYERGKVPVVLIHGLWGNPRLWNPMLADLEADSALRRRYQFWTFRYASGDSIPYSAHLLRQSLRQARRVCDPDGTDTAFEQMVLVGHSLGGILAKMMVQSSGSRLWQTVSALPFDQVGGAPEARRLLERAFFYQPVPEVRRVVFIATPHRGSPLASGTLRDLGTRLCVRRSRFVQARENVMANNGPDLFTSGFLAELPTSAGELAPEHPLLLSLCDLRINASVRSHSIIADLRDPPGPGATDGIVPYSSAHLEGARSELLVRGLHICLNHPAVIREIRRILVEHAGIEGASPARHQAMGSPESNTPLGLPSGARGATESPTANSRGFLAEVEP
jgi:pimeloyl-ACP methyl ester carboxylesterase